MSPNTTCFTNVLHMINYRKCSPNCTIITKLIDLKLINTFQESDKSKYKDIPDKIPAVLIIGTKVTGIHTFQFPKKICDGRESNSDQLLGRQLC